MSSNSCQRGMCALLLLCALATVQLAQCQPQQQYDPNDLSPFVGMHFIYKYTTGGKYEVYLKNATSMDYRIHQNSLAGKWVTDQQIVMTRMDEDAVRLSWEEPSGTVASNIFMPRARLYHGTVFFAKWVLAYPARTGGMYQNEHIPEVLGWRAQGPIDPRVVAVGWANITFLEFAGLNNASVINCLPSLLPAGYADRVNGQPPTEYPPSSLEPFVGLHIHYTYLSGQSLAEIYLKNDTHMDFLVQHGTGPSAFKVCVRRQPVTLSRLSDDMLRITWMGNSNTNCLSNVVQPVRGRFFGLTFFGKKVYNADDPLFPHMFTLIDEQATIDSIEKVDINQENVITQCTK